MQSECAYQYYPCLMEANVLYNDVCLTVQTAEVSESDKIYLVHSGKSKKMLKIWEQN